MLGVCVPWKHLHIWLENRVVTESPPYIEKQGVQQTLDFLCRQLWCTIRREKESVHAMPHLLTMCWQKLMRTRGSAFWCLMRCTCWKRDHGGSFFGKALNKPDELATTILSFMMKCINGGPEFMAKMLPVAKLDASFQYSECVALTDCIKQNGDILAIIADGNRVNQKFFKKFKPWLTHLPNSNKPTFLLHDYVFVLKCIWNNWLTEENGELDFVWNGEKFIAKWNILCHLHLIEQ